MAITTRSGAKEGSQLSRWALRTSADAPVDLPAPTLCPQITIMNRNKPRLQTWADVQEVTPGSRPDRQRCCILVTYMNVYMTTRELQGRLKLLFELGTQRVAPSHQSVAQMTSQLQILRELDLRLAVVELQNWTPVSGKKDLSNRDQVVCRRFLVEGFHAPLQSHHELLSGWVKPCYTLSKCLHSSLLQSAINDLLEWLTLIMN